MPPLRVLFARFPFGASEHPDVTDWITDTFAKAKADPRIGAVHRMRVDDTPITMGRNRVLKTALDNKIDLVLMIDSDMGPDVPYPGAKPFWDSSLDFMLAHEGPCAVGAPYCGPPPCENVYVFHWTRQETDDPNVDLKLSQYTREQATLFSGIQEVAALPTGIFLLDVRALKVPGFEPPWFEYEWTDKYQTQKASTEDVFFTRNLSLAGVPMYCNWDAWAIHHKRKKVLRPQALTVSAVRQQFREALLSGVEDGDRLVEVTRDGVSTIRGSHDGEATNAHLHPAPEADARAEDEGVRVGGGDEPGQPAEGRPRATKGRRSGEQLLGRQGG